MATTVTKFPPLTIRCDLTSYTIELLNVLFYLYNERNKSLFTQPAACIATPSYASTPYPAQWPEKAWSHPSKLSQLCERCRHRIRATILRRTATVMLSILILPYKLSNIHQNRRLRCAFDTTICTSARSRCLRSATSFEPRIGPTTRTRL